VTSSAKARANRRNARKSTGPKTLAGKAIAARNALRHGLTLPVVHDRALAPEVEALARQIEESLGGRAAGVRRHEFAHRIAEAQIDIIRVRHAKLGPVAVLVEDPQASVELLRLDRYERYARRRRALAIRALGGAGKAAAVARRRFDKTKPNGKSQ